MERKHPKKNGFKVVSLFAGIGGFDLGFENAGFELVWANDFDKYAVETYKANIGSKIVLGDIREAKKCIPQHDVLIGGFPCQPFSSLGKQKGFNDEGRGNLFFEIIDIINTHNPKAVILENVKNIVTHDEKRTFKRILEELDKAGYYTNWKILNSADYGIPQRRNRLFLVAFRKEVFKDVPFQYPNPIPLQITTQDLLDHNVDAKYFLTKKIAKTILSSGSGGYIAKPTIDLPISKTLTATMHKMHRASQDTYVTDKKSRLQFVDDNRIDVRKLTPEECRKLQGFPSGWLQVVSDCQAYKQFGNAVTVDVSYAVAKEVAKHMLKNCK